MRSAQIPRSVALAVIVLLVAGACGASPGASAPPAPPTGATASAAARPPTATIEVTASPAAAGTASPTASATVSSPPETPAASAAAGTPSVAPAPSGTLTVIDWGGSFAGTAAVVGCKARNAAGDCVMSVKTTVATSICARLPGYPHSLRVNLGSPDPRGASVDLVVDDTRQTPAVASKFAIRLPERAPLHDVVVDKGGLATLDVIDGGDHASITLSANAANGDVLTAVITCNAINP